MKIVVPELGESVVEATIVRWLVPEGTAVAAGQGLVELETDKVNVEVSAERAGVLARILKRDGDDVRVGEEIGVLEVAAEGAAGGSVRSTVEAGKGESAKGEVGKGQIGTAQVPAGAAAASPARVVAGTAAVGRATGPASAPASGTPPAALPVSTATSAAPKTTPERRVEIRLEPEAPPPDEVRLEPEPGVATLDQVRLESEPVAAPERREEKVRMSRRRRTIAHRLVEAQRTAAMLTTFNEIDMSSVMETRRAHKESFQKRHGVNLGIVSFFVKATVAALKAVPQLNSEIRGDDLVLKRYYDLGVAIGSAEGLIVPVLRNADRMSFAQIEQAIKDFARKSDEGSISLEDLRGGTFTITNGGVFGSLLSTPILNPPEVGILGLHRIEERPVAVAGQVVVRPMMYVALTYDHRVVDGREAVTFLVKVKEFVEDPRALLLEG